MKLKIPDNAKIWDFRSRIGVLIVEIPGLDGWDILDRLAVENRIPTDKFRKILAIDVYSDHITLHSNDIELENLSEKVFRILI